MFYRKNVLINYSQATPSFSNTSGVLLVCRKGGTETAETVQSSATRQQCCNNHFIRKNKIVCFIRLTDLILKKSHKILGVSDVVCVL